jgi:hypothetical protein
MTDVPARILQGKTGDDATHAATTGAAEYFDDDAMLGNIFLETAAAHFFPFFKGFEKRVKHTGGVCAGGYRTGHAEAETE